MNEQKHQQARAKLAQQFVSLSTASDQAKTALSVIALDIDRFRRVNETFGHDVGDQVLDDLSRIVEQHVQPPNAFVRWSGDEYLILCPQATLADAETLSETIRQAVKGHTFPTVGRVTVTLGVTTCRASDSLDDAVKRADQAVYQAKEKGGNQAQSAG